MEGCVPQARVPRMRTIEQCAEYILQKDPETMITKYRIRKLVKENKIKHLMCGRKILVDLDYLLKYMSEPSEPEKTEVKKIRRMVI